MTVPKDPIAEREKRLVALSSVIAAVFLTGMKLAVGLLTNSLGILSEAAHSGLDLVAAAMTYLAVRISDRPPDWDHPYGHGKVENLSALAETILLLVTCAWIVTEAVERLAKPVPVDVTFWSFAVLVVSIAVDLTRSRALRKMARKHSSQALEADALHFSTDVWSSAVVIVGLLAVLLAPWLQARAGIPEGVLIRADAVAALGVAALSVYVSLRLVRRTIDVLLDRTSREMTQRIEEALKDVRGLSAVRRIRLRQSGPATFVDMTLDVPRSTSLEEAHELATEAEEVVKRIVPRSDVVVHIDPVVKDERSLLESVRSAAARHGLGVHGLRAYDVRGRQSLSMHIEVLDHLTLGEAHDRVSRFEAALREETPGLGRIVTHIEPVGDTEARREAVRTRSREVRQALQEISRLVPGLRDCHEVEIFREGEELSVFFHCLVDPEVPIRDAHRLTTDLEALLRARVRGLGRVVIHVEPPEGRGGEGPEQGARGSPPTLPDN